MSVGDDEEEEGVFGDPVATTTTARPVIRALNREDVAPQDRGSADGRRAAG
jgi:hypothetical protein